MGVFFLIAILFAKNQPRFSNGKNNDNSQSNKNLASCLKKKGVKMYGAFYCGYCKQQMQMLGNSPDVPYVECVDKSKNLNPECGPLNLKAFPTWIFPNGKRIDGTATISQLKEYAGC